MNLFRLKPALMSLLLFGQTQSRPASSTSHFRYQRHLFSVPSASVGQSGNRACAILDSDVFAHAASTLKDLRLYNGSREIPYTTTVIEPQQQDSDDAKILRPRTQHGRIVFDLEMPRRPYTRIELNLAAHDFVATAVVTGYGDQPKRNARTATQLGIFTIFDLTSQHLFHDTGIPLSESTFPVLHVELSLSPTPGNPASSASLNLPSVIQSVSVPPSREGQSLYTAAQPASAMVQTGFDSIATFNIPARVPVERVSFVLPVEYRHSFSRTVKIEAQSVNPGGPQSQDDPASWDDSSPEDVAGTILRIHQFESGRDISAEDLSVPVAIGSNMQQPAVIKVHVENGPDGPIPLSVELQMRQRRLCFDAAANDPLMLYYGDPSLGAPVSSSGNLQSAVAPRMVELGPETLNPAFAARLSPPRFGEQRPVLRWIALLACVCTFALLVIRSTHKRRR